MTTSQPTDMGANQTGISSNETYFRWSKWDYIFPEAVNSVLIVLTLWIIIALVHFGIKTNKWGNSKKKNVDKLSAGRVLTAALISAIMTFGRLITSQFVYNLGYSDMQCEEISDSSYIVYCLASFSVYMFLWIRQSIFYTNRMLNTNFSKGLKFFSYLSIVLITLGGLSVILLGTITKEYYTSQSGCIYQSASEGSEFLLVLVCGLVLLAGQAGLVGLFVYPLRKHQTGKKCLSTISLKKKTENGNGSVSFTRSATVRANRKLKNTQKINRILRRSIVFATIAIVTDLIFLFVSNYTFTGKMHRRIPTMLYDISAFLNLVFVVSSFISWKMILLSPTTSRPQKTSSHQGTFGSNTT